MGRQRRLFSAGGSSTICCEGSTCGLLSFCAHAATSSKAAGGHLFCRLGDGALDAGVAAAAAVVVAHSVDDLVLAGGWILGEKGGGGHDLAAHAPGTLGYLDVDKGLLERVQDKRAVGVRRSHALDRTYLFTLDQGQRGNTGTGGDAVDMDGAGAADTGAAAKTRADHPQFVAQHPEQEITRPGCHLDGRPVDIQLHAESSFTNGFCISFAAILAGHCAAGQ